MTQNQMLLSMMRDTWVSPAAALNEIGCMRLASRIYELRRAGVPVESRTIRKLNRFGRAITYKEYRVKEDA